MQKGSNKRMSRQDIKRMSVKKMTIQRKSELQEFQQDTQKADWDKALQYREKMTPRQENKQLYPMSIETNKLGKYGIGLLLFFDFIKFSAICFFIMALISIPAMVSNASGGGLEQSYSSQANSYGALTIANQPELTLTAPATDATDAEIAVIEAANSKAIDDFVTEMNTRQYWIVIPDMVYTGVFLLFIFLWRRRSKQIKKELRTQEAVPSHYCIYVTGFSSDMKDEAIFRKHFSQFGHIQEAKIVRNYYGTLFYHKKEADILHKIAIENRKLELNGKEESKKLIKLEDKLTDVQENIHEITTKKLGSVVSYDQYPAIGCYVVFNSIKEKVQCVEAYDNAHACCGDKDQRCYFNGKLLQVRAKVDEPSNIKWENLDVTKSQRCGRICVVIFAVICVMILTFAIIFIANIVKPSNSTSCPTTYTWDEAQAASDSTVTECYCRQQGLSTLQNDATIQKYCWDVYVQYVSLTILTIGTALTVIIVNFLLKILLRAFGKFSKFATISKETTGITLALFFAMFVNTALITLLLQAEIFGWTPAISISSPIPPIQTLQQDKATEFSPDFDRAWYVEVGAKVTMTMFISIFSPHLMFWALIPCFRRQRLKKAKKQVIQKDMNNFVMGAQFQVTGYYAASLNTIFVTLFYCSGIPLLLLFGSASLTIQFWVYKYYLLRYNKRPPAYDVKLNKKIISVLPIAVILHLMVGIYMYGSPLIFPYDSSSISSSTSTTSTTSTATVTGDSSFSSISSRIQNQLLMFIMLIVVVAIQIIDRTLVVVLKKCYKVLFCIKKKNNLVAVAPNGQKSGVQNKKKGDLFGTYLEEYDAMKQRMIASYDIRLNEEYQHLIQAIEIGKQDHEQHALMSQEINSNENTYRVETPNNKASQHQKKKHHFNVTTNANGEENNA